jgi:hypothetical protein
MIKPRRLPRIGENNSNINTRNFNSINNNNIPVPNNLFQKKRKNPEEDLPINKNTDPDFIRKYRKLRNRHQEDFAISLVPNSEDIISEDTHLYENKEINLESQKIKEIIGLENTEFYIESIHHDQYYKINQIKKEEKQKEEILGDQSKISPKKRRKSTHKIFTALEQAQLLENKLYNKFDKELTDVITKTLSKVTIIFLFAQGLLAGMGLLHVILFLTYDEYKQFLYLLSRMIIILYDIFHALTFTSLVGNGIKFVSSYQKYNIMNLQIHGNNNEFMRLRRDMIFSGILLVFFTVVFGFEVYLATFIQKINLNKCYNVPEGGDFNNDIIYMDESEFKNFKYCHIVLDFVVIILFILNIFDLNIRESGNERSAPINVNFYLGTEPNNDNNLEVISQN